MLKRTTTTHLPSREHSSQSSSLSAFHPSQGHPSRHHPSRGRPSSRRRRPRRMAQTDIPEMEKHHDGGPIRLSFPSQRHPPVPFVSAIRLLQFNSSKYALTSVTVQFVYLGLKTIIKIKKKFKTKTCKNKEKPLQFIITS